MIKSMTGFASLTHEDERATIAVTVRAVNHRFLDLQLRVPHAFGDVEPRLRALLQKRLARGRVEVGISVTGVAGPGGGTPEKPVGLVHFYVSTPDGGEARSFSLPGDRATIRSRATVSALHLARRVLTRSRHEVA